MNSVIYLVEAQQKLSQAIVNMAIENGYEIYIFKKFSDLLIDVRKHRPDAIFINKRLLPDTYDEFLEIKSYYIVLYGHQIEWDERLNYYTMGVDRILDGEYFSPHALVQLLKKRHVFLKQHQQFSRGDLVHASLRQISLKNILEEAVREKKSFALKIYDNGWNGNMRVIRGKVDHVRCMEKTNPEALLDILHRSRGEVFLKYFSDSKETEPVNFSTLGVLLEYQYQQNLMAEFENELGTRNPVFNRTSDNQTSKDFQEHLPVIRLIDQKLTFSKIIVASPYSINQTVKILQNLYQGGYIEVDRDTLTQGKLSEEEIEHLFEHLLPSKQKQGQILVLGTTEESKQIIIQGFAKTFGRPFISQGPIDLCEISPDNVSTLNILGISLDRFLKGKIKNSIPQLVGTLFIFDFAQRLTFDYKKYFLRQYLAENTAPLMIGILNLSRLHDTAISEFHKVLEIPGDVPVLALQGNKISDFRALLDQLVRLTQQNIKRRQ